MSEASLHHTPVIARPISAVPSRGVITRSTSIIPKSATTLVQWIPYAARHLTNVGRVGFLGWALIVSSVIVLLALDLPQRKEAQRLQQEISSARGSSTESVKGRHQVREIVGQLPTRAELPGVLKQMMSQSEAAGVLLESGRYEQLSEAGGIARYRFSFPVKGSYASINLFVNGALASIPSAGIDALRIERKSISDSLVEADLRFIVFVRAVP